MVRNIAIYSFSLFLLPSIVPGAQISGGVTTFIIGGVGLALMFLILKPILSIISFPVNLITLGVSSILTNVLILYLLTIFISGVVITDFTYQPLSYMGFSTPEIYFNLFFSYVLSSIVISVIDSSLSWLMK